MPEDLNDPVSPPRLARKSTIFGRNIVSWAENGTIHRSTKVPLTTLPPVNKLFDRSCVWREPNRLAPAGR